ncbi:MAG: transporter substrate-binding protein [Paenibacillus sp.]|jgi:MarR-like DNA-binding transcriptional regulator SgrR of sgrS sRNA|nr:transporter substrate-binding protein [Paenibacillus sp.]
MKLHSHYLRLHSYHGSTEEISIHLDEIAVTLDCTHRNAMIIISNMVEHKWISWVPMRGRGRRSILRFLVPPEEIAVQSMMQAMNRRDITRKIDPIKVHARSAMLQDHLQGWLLTYFGHHTEIRRDKQIDTLRIPIRQQIHTIDPLYMNLLVESFVSSHIFDGLVRRTNDSYEILPHIAHAWEVDAARKEWTFYLRKEVLFHNGRVMTAEDVVYSLNRLIQTSRRTLYSYIFKQIDAVQALTPNTVRVKLKEPNELFLPFLCTSRAAIVPKDLDQLGETKFGIRPIGTGPFRIKELNESICSLEVFSHYFRGRAHLDRVEVVHVPLQIPSENTDPLAPFHVIHNPKPTEGETWSQIHSKTSVRKFITCNTSNKGILTDPNIRAHIGLCLQDERSVDTIDAADKGKVVDNIEIARSGHSRIIQIATIPQYKQDADYAARKLVRAGYSCKVQLISLEQFKGPIRLESDLILFSLLRDQDEQLRLFDLYQTLSEHVESHARVDIEQVLHNVSREPDIQRRAAWFERIEARLIQEFHLFILNERQVQTAFLPSVRGVTFNTQGWVDLRTVWFPPLDNQADSIGTRGSSTHD